MKEDIKKKLNHIKEGRLATDTPSNPQFDGKIFYLTPEHMRAEIANAIRIYNENPGAFGSTEEGDGLYEFVLYPVKGGKFAFGGKHSSIGHKRAPGTYKDSQGGGTRYFWVRASKTTPIDDFGGRNSPMSYAKVKLLYFMGPQVMDFIDGIQGYEDEKAASISKEKTPDKWAYKFDKYEKELEKRKRKGLISLDDDEKEIRSKLRDVVNQRIEAQKNRDRELVKQLKNIEKQLRRELESLGEVDEDEIFELHLKAVKSVDRSRNKLSESMTLQIKDFPYDDELDTIGDMTHFLKRKLWYNFLDKAMSDEEKENFRENSLGSDIFSPDGSDYFEETGTINFYTRGISEEWVKKIVSFVKYVLNEENVILGNISGPEQSGSYRSEVIRIPVVKNESNHNNPPDINLSNNNARFVFDEIMNINVEDYINVGDLVAATNKALEALPNMEIDSRPKISGNVFMQRMDKPYIEKTLKRIRDFAMWANKHGYNTLYLA